MKGLSLEFEHIKKEQLIIGDFLLISSHRGSGSMFLPIQIPVEVKEVKDGDAVYFEGIVKTPDGTYQCNGILTKQDRGLIDIF